MIRRLAAASLAVVVLSAVAVAPAAAGEPRAANAREAVVAPEPVVAPEAEQDPVRKAEYWLDEYGIKKAWQTTRG